MTDQANKLDPADDPAPTTIPAPPSATVAQAATEPDPGIDNTDPDAVMAAFVAVVMNRTPATETGPLAYYRAARPYLTAALYGEVTDPNMRGDPAWPRWHETQAVLGGEIVRAGHPNGAPADTATVVYRTTWWTPTITWPDGRTESGNVERRTVILALVDSRWLINRFFNA